MKIWAVGNQKGGVGKTTTAVTLAGLLAQAGRRVLVIDLDPQGSLTHFLGIDPQRVTASVYDLFDMPVATMPARVNDVIVPTGLPKLELMPASSMLATLERHSMQRNGAGLTIARALAILWDRYDVVLMDTTPTLGVLLINALAACQRVIIPVQTEFLALKGLDGMLRSIEMVTRSRQRPLQHVIVPTMYDRRTHASQACLLQLRKQYMEGLWPGFIPIDTRLRDASSAHLPPSAYAPNSRAVAAYARLLRYLDRADGRSDNHSLTALDGSSGVMPLQRGVVN